MVERPRRPYHYTANDNVNAEAVDHDVIYADDLEGRVVTPVVTTSDLEKEIPRFIAAVLRRFSSILQSRDHEEVVVRADALVGKCYRAFVDRINNDGETLTVARLDIELKRAHKLIRRHLEEKREAGHDDDFLGFWFLSAAFEDFM